MSKSHGSLQDDPGKNVGTLASKEGGSLDKDALSDADAGADTEYGSYDSDYSGGSDYSSSSGGSDSSGGYDSSGSGSDTTAGSDVDDETGGASDPDGADDTGGGEGSESDGTLRADSNPDDTSGDTGGDNGSGEQVEGEIDGDTDGTKPIEVIPPANKVSIDIEAMTRLVAAMERAGDQIATYQAEFRRILGGVMLDSSEVSSFDQVISWIEEELPGLRRRLALAQDLDGTTSTPRPDGPQTHVPRIPYVGDENLIPNHPPRQSYDNGRDAAERFAVPPEHKPATREIVADLETGRHDPYFAKEFVHNTEPDEVVRVVLRATSDGGDSTEHDQLVRLTASTVATASRGTGELAPPEGYEEQWARLRNSDDPETAALAARLRPGPAEE